MDFWNSLVNTALLGTDKKSVDTDLLPDRLKQVAQTISTSDREAQLLKIAIASVQYMQAGTRPQSLTQAGLTVCPPETQPYCPPAATRTLKTLLAEHPTYITLLAYWLDTSQAKGWIVPPDLLVRLLNAGAEKKYMHLQEKIRNVVGKRGQWLSQMNEKWQYTAETSLEQIWLEGKPVERKEVFRKLREQDPEKALHWLQQSWKEESPKDRKDFMELLRINLSPADESFLHTIREEMLELGSKAKAIHLEMKALTTQLLLSLPESALSQQVWEKVHPYCQIQPPLLSSGKPEIRLILPDEEDAFFNPDTMHAQFGLDKSSPLPKYTNAEYWLNELIAYIPPARWQAYFKCDAENALSVFANPDGAFTKVVDKAPYPLFAISLANAIATHSDVQWASAWLKNFPATSFRTDVQIHIVRLVSLLPQAELEKYVEEHLGGPSSLKALLTHPRLIPWSLPFTLFILQSISKYANDYYRLQQDQEFLERAVLHIPPDILTRLEEFKKVKLGRSEYTVQQWIDKIETPLTQMLSIRQEIEKW